MRRAKRLRGREGRTGGTVKEEEVVVEEGEENG